MHHETLLLMGAKVDKSQIEYEDKKIYVLSLNFELCTCSLNLSSVHVLSVWVVCKYSLSLNYEHMFSQFELCMCSLSLCTCSLSLCCVHVLSVCVVYMFSQFELCTCSLSLSCACVLSVCAHVLSVWVVHVFSQFVHMFSQFELYTCFLSLNTQTERTCTQFKIERQIFFLHTAFGFLSTLAPHSSAGVVRYCLSHIYILWYGLPLLMYHWVLCHIHLIGHFFLWIIYHAYPLFTSNRYFLSFTTKWSIQLGLHHLERVQLYSIFSIHHSAGILIAYTLSQLKIRKHVQYTQDNRRVAYKQLTHQINCC